MAATATDGGSNDNLTNVNSNDLTNTNHLSKHEKLHEKSHEKNEHNVVGSSKLHKKLNASHIASSKEKDSGDRGWNKVRSKSERYENRNTSNYYGSSSGTSEKYRGTAKRHPPFRSYSRKAVKDRVPLNSANLSNDEVNGGNMDSHSSNDSADSDSKKGEVENKSKSEFVAAPIPKTNPWSKQDSPSIDPQLSKFSKDLVSEQANNRTLNENFAASGKVQKLPPNCEWGKVGDKETIINPENETSSNKEIDQGDFA